LAEFSEREGEGPASPRRVCMRRSWLSRGSGGGARIRFYDDLAGGVAVDAPAPALAAVLALVCPDGPDGVDCGKLGLRETRRLLRSWAAGAEREGEA